MLYERVEVWKRLAEGSVVCFQCVKRLPDGMFAVQSADFFHPPASKVQAAGSHNQFAELMMEDDPSVRTELWRMSLEEAVAAHEEHFAPMWDSIRLATF